MEKSQAGNEFGVVTLKRPIKLFGTAFGTDGVVGVPFSPNPEFLVRVLTDHRSSLTLLRRKLGTSGQLKNFENYVRGRHESSLTTKDLLARGIGIDPSILDGLVHGAKDGPLVPDFLRVFVQLEEIPYRVASHVLDADMLCPHCMKNVLKDREAYWHSQPFNIDPTSYAFADRLLTALVGAASIASVIFESTKSGSDLFDVGNLQLLETHPFGYWLTNVQRARGLSTLARLTEEMQQLEEKSCQVDYGRVTKWSSGADLMRCRTANAIATMTGNEFRHQLEFRIARGLAFVIDFLTAAADGEAPKKRVIQRTVMDRYKRLHTVMWFAARKKAEKSSKTSTETG